MLTLSFALKASGLLATSALSGYYARNTYTSVSNNIITDQPLVYPNFPPPAFIKNSHNLIVCIPQKYVSSNSPVGKISLNGQHSVPNIDFSNSTINLTSFFNVTSTLLNSKSQTIASCILFPTKFNDLLEINNGTCKFSIDKTFYTTSGPRYVIDKYINIIRTETSNPNFSLMVSTDSFSKLFLKEELVTDTNVYLLCVNDVMKNKLVVRMMSDNVKHIYNEKYYWEYVKCGVLGTLSIVSLLGIALIERK